MHKNTKLMTTVVVCWLYISVDKAVSNLMLLLSILLDVFVSLIMITGTQASAKNKKYHAYRIKGIVR